jgi:CheY-like chemotaxis protein
MRAENSKLRPHESKARILVVNDQPEVSGTIQDAPECPGFEVGTAENGRQALNLLMSGHHFDLVFQ